MMPTPLSDGPDSFDLLLDGVSIDEDTPYPPLEQLVPNIMSLLDRLNTMASESSSPRERLILATELSESAKQAIVSVVRSLPGATFSVLRLIE
jgi:hypothetical protein